MVYSWILGQFLVNYDVAFFANGSFIEGYIDTESIETIVAYSSFLFKYFHFLFTYDAQTIVNLILFISFLSSIFSRPK